MAVEKVGQDKSVAHKKTCKNCGAILKFYKKDIKHDTSCSFGDMEVSSYIVCPECKAHVSVKEN